MVTGCSTADLVVVLVDARQGITEQTRRHAFIASLLRIPHLVSASTRWTSSTTTEARFEEIRRGVRRSSPTRLEVPDLTFIPISALDGDNVVDRSTEMAWYDGPSLLAPPRRGAHRARTAT